jgi:hypothetical protein
MPGTWNLWQTGKNLLLFACPKCGDVFVILSPVKTDGLVQGKVKCTQPWCPFEDAVKLVGWKPEKNGEGGIDLNH